MILHQLITHRLPFPLGITQPDVFQLTKDCTTRVPLDGLKAKKVSDRCLDLAEKMLNKFSKKRITVKEALNHPFFDE